MWHLNKLSRALKKSVDIFLLSDKLFFPKKRNSMKFFKSCLILMMLGCSLVSCNGAYNDALADGKVHACDLKNLLTQAKQNPGDEALIKQITEKTEFLQISREQSGNSEKFQKDIQDYLMTECK
jgi:hypothetical protein